MSTVKAWKEKVTIPTYEIGEAEKHPVFLEKRVYQASSGSVYPNPVVEHISDEKVDKEWDAMSNSNAIILDEFTADLQPIVRIIDDWFENRRTALIFEVKVGKGSLLISGVDLHSNLENRPEAVQLRYSLTKYMAGDRFNPKISLSGVAVQNLFVE